MARYTHTKQIGTSKEDMWEFGCPARNGSYHFTLKMTTAPMDEGPFAPRCEDKSVAPL